MGYVNLLRRTYVTLCERYESPDQLIQPRDPKWWASRSTGGIVGLHGMSLFLAYLHWNGRFPNVSKSLFVIFAAILSVAAYFAQKKFVESDKALLHIREKLRTETKGDKGLRDLSIYFLQSASFIVFLVLLYSLD